MSNTTLTLRPTDAWYAHTEKAIDAGIAFLDERFGRKTWLKGIDLDELDLEDGSYCVCGQLFSDDAPAGLDGYTYAVREVLEDYFHAKGNIEVPAGTDVIGGDQHMRAVALGFNVAEYESDMGIYITVDDIFGSASEVALQLADPSELLTLEVGGAFDVNVSLWRELGRLWTERIAEMKFEALAPHLTGIAVVA